MLNEFVTFQLEFLPLLKICYGGDVPTCYYRKDCGKVNSLKEESCQVSCVKRGTALKLNYEVKAPGSILRYALKHLCVSHVLLDEPRKKSLSSDGKGGL